MTLSQEGHKTTPAMAAGVTDRARSIDDIAGLLEAKERKAIEAEEMKRGKYCPRVANSN